MTMEPDIEAHQQRRPNEDRVMSNVASSTDTSNQQNQGNYERFLRRYENATSDIPRRYEFSDACPTSVVILKFAPSKKHNFRRPHHKIQRKAVFRVGRSRFRGTLCSLGNNRAASMVSAADACDICLCQRTRHWSNSAAAKICSGRADDPLFLPAAF